MKSILLSLLVFICLHATAQLSEVAKIKTIFASQQYVVTVSNSEGVNTYQFVKQKTPRSTSWLLTANNKTHKVIWNNYQDFEWKITRIAHAYFMDSLSTHPPLPGYATFTIVSPSQSITFQAPSINIPKRLWHAGTFGDNQGYHPNFAFRH